MLRGFQMSMASSSSFTVTLVLPFFAATSADAEAKSFKVYAAIGFVLTLGLILFSIFLLWLVVKRRDLWLKYIAAEERFNARLHMPSWFISASRKFEEGRGAVYFTWASLIAAVVLFYSLIALCLLFIYVRHRSQIGPLVPLLRSLLG